MKRAFSLVELLVVVAVIAVLSSLLLPAMGRVREKGRQVRCISNVSQITRAHLMYSSDDSKASFSAKESSDDFDVNWLQPYLKFEQVWVCPATHNVVRTNKSFSPVTGRYGLSDLIALGTRGSKAGKSYQSLGFMSVGTPYSMTINTSKLGEVSINGIRKSESTVSSYVKYHNAFGLGGTTPGASSVWIVIDSLGVGKPYFPDEGDNHGISGTSVGFCDGHVEFVGSREFIFKYELSQDENRTGPSLTW